MTIIKRAGNDKNMAIISVKIFLAFATGFVGGCVFRNVGIPHSLSMPIGYMLGLILSTNLK